MTFKSLEDLRDPDERTLAFSPFGLGGRMEPQDAAHFQQAVVGDIVLDPRIAEGTRSSYEQLRTVFAYGVLCYEIYTLIHDHALLVIEQALRDRFVDFHNGTVTFVDADDNDHLVPVQTYEEVHEFLKRRAGRNRGDRWRVRLPNGNLVPFSGGMLSDLRAWARQAGLLRGQRNRGIEQAMASLRNMVAHPIGYHLDGPVEAARELRDLAEIINQLWGAPTPGGRLYPAPRRREVAVMAWRTEARDMTTAIAADAFSEFIDPPDHPWTCVILRAVFDPVNHFSDPQLRHYDSLAEVTWYPTDLLWGPGTITDAAAWFAEHQPQPDMCDHLDRTFLIRKNGPSIHLPVRPETAASMRGTETTGTWYAVRADYPHDAFLHARNLIANVGCARSGPCRQCHAETLTTGHLADVLTRIGATVSDAPLPHDVQTPWANPRVRQLDA